MKLTNYKGFQPIGWNRLMDTFFDEDTFFTPQTNLNIPATNVLEKDEAYQITMAVPGLSKEDFNIEVDKGLLTISSEKRKSAETQEDNYTRQEYSYNSFSRSFHLPQNVKEDDIIADYNNGELILTVPKNKITIPTVKNIEVR